jgi:hypothetical protein
MTSKWHHNKKAAPPLKITAKLTLTFSFLLFFKHKVLVLLPSVNTSVIQLKRYYSIVKEIFKDHHSKADLFNFTTKEFQNKQDNIIYYNYVASTINSTSNGSFHRPRLQPIVHLVFFVFVFVIISICVSRRRNIIITNCTW